VTRPSQVRQKARSRARLPSDHRAGDSRGDPGQLRPGRRPAAKRRIGARELLSEVLDNDSFVSWDTGLVSIPASDEYLNQLAEARQTSGLDEAVMTGEGTIRGRRVCVNRL